jgi:probable HAF family extracellular repeat protein
MPGNLTASVGNGINNAGQVVGSSATIEDLGTQHAFIWEDGMSYDLNSLVDLALSGEYLINATSINENSQIVAASNFGKTYVLTQGEIAFPVPIPGAFWLLVSGLAGLRRKK